MSDNNNFVSSFISFLAGAAIGAGFALLYAPQSGEETRKQIKDLGEKVSEDVKENAQKAVDKVKETSDSAVSQIKTFVNTAKDSITKEK